MSFKTTFTVLDARKKPSDEDIKNIPPFIFCRWLGGSLYTVRAANQLNLYYKELPMLNQYTMIKQGFAGKNIYIPFPKSTKNDDSILPLLSKHFNINLEKASEYKKLLSDEEIKNIIDMYKGIK